MGKKPYRNEYGTDKPIVIEEMTIEQCKLFFEHKATCKERTCSKCACNSFNFANINEVCVMISSRVTLRTVELLESIVKEKPPTSIPKEKACIYCDHYNTHLGDDGYSFCMCWHNFTQRDGYCHNFACKSVPEAVI